MIGAIISIIIVEQSKNCRCSADHDHICRITQVFLNIRRIAQGGEVKANACSGGGGNSGEGEKLLFH